MQELLNHPAVQAGFAPFLAALLAAAIFHRVRLSGLAIIAGFAVTIYLASNFNFIPLTSSRKLVLCGLVGTALAIPLGLIQARWIKSLLPVIAGAAVIWVTYRILQQQDLTVMAQWGAACVAYVAILVWGMDQLQSQPLRAASAAIALGFGTGGAALVGASALLGQFGLAIGSAAVAHLLIQVSINPTLSAGRVFTFPVALITGITGCVAVLSAELPWYALILLAGIPLSAQLLRLRNAATLTNSMKIMVITCALAGAAIFLTWRSAGDVPF